MYVPLILTFAFGEFLSPHVCLQAHFDDVHGIDCWWHDLMSSASDKCDPCWIDAEDPLFMLYTRYSIILCSIYCHFLLHQQLLSG